VEVLLFTIDAGGGHRAAARALVAAAEETGVPWRLRVFSLQGVLLPHDPLRRLTGRSIEEAYNWLLRRRLGVTMVPLLRLLHGAILVRRRPLVRALGAWLAERPRPSAVVSVFPNFNGIIRDALRAAHPGVPLLVVLTDFADFPPRFWIEPGLDRVIVGTEEARAQALAIGLPPERVSRVSGMVLHPRFDRTDGGTRERVRAELGFAPSGFVVTLLFGGKGSAEMPPLAEALLDAGGGRSLIAICGDNPALFERLAPLEARGLRRFGFTDRVAELLAASDVLVTKPGPGTLAEAFHKRVPVVVVRDRSTIPQERFNTDYVERHGLGLVVQDWREIPGAVARLQRDEGERAGVLARLSALPPNRAVYEAVALIGREAAACAASPG
jgi:1,2-diacylglycerol 3-beta-galactosyltransferase